MKNNKSLPVARNHHAFSLTFRHSDKFEHRNAPRGGATNEHTRLMAEYQEDLEDSESAHEFSN
jgi:hypothetical protein